MNSLVIRFAWAAGGGWGWEGLVVEGNLVCCLITVVNFIRLGKTYRLGVGEILKLSYG